MGKVIYGSINSRCAPPPPPTPHCLLISKLLQMPHGGASERVQMTNLWNKKAIIAHKITYFCRICNSSNRYLTAKLQLFHVPCTFFFLSSLVRKWKQLCKYLHMLELEPCAAFKVWKYRVVFSHFSTELKIHLPFFIHYFFIVLLKDKLMRSGQMVMHESTYPIPVTQAEFPTPPPLPSHKLCFWLDCGII